MRGTQIELAHSRIHARDCEDCKSEDGYVDRIDVQLDLEGALSPEQTRRLLEIADRCPVHKTLEGEVSIRSTSV